MKQNKMYFNPETGRYQTTPAKPSVMSHLNYLARHTQDLVDADNAFRNHPFDWTDFATLKREGYILDDIADLRTTHEHDRSRYDLHKNEVVVPFRYKPGIKTYVLGRDQMQLPRSILAHEYGHAKDLHRTRKAWLGLINKKISPIRVCMQKYRNLHPGLTMFYSVESLTNGTHKVPTIRAEEAAWDKASGPYDVNIRDLALNTYRKEVSDKWNLRALEELASYDYSTKDALKRVRDGYIPERFFPDLVDFWRTNSVPSAINALTKQKVLSPRDD
jgi:hypothetical protein